MVVLSAGVTESLDVEAARLALKECPGCYATTISVGPCLTKVSTGTKD